MYNVLNKKCSLSLLLAAQLCLVWMFVSCTHPPFSQDKATDEIKGVEADFMKMVQDKGVAEAFAFFADDSAVILRGRDSLIKGRDAIKNYYSSSSFIGAKVKWKPDFIDVSPDGSLAYTYGRYFWKVPRENGDTLNITGIFHTVWKRQPDGSWKYVWD